MATFNIGTQNAASVQNIGGNVVFQGGLYADAMFVTRELRVTIARAQRQAAEIELPAELRILLEGALDSAAAEAAREHPDKGRVADLLGMIAGTLKEAGTAATAGTALIETLRHAAKLLGPVGHAVLALL